MENPFDFGKPEEINHFDFGEPKVSKNSSVNSKKTEINPFDFGESEESSAIINQEVDPFDFGEPGNEPDYFADTAKAVTGGLVTGIGSGARGAGEAFREGGELVAGGINAAAEAMGFDPQLRAENPLKGAAEYFEQSGQEILDTRTPAAIEAERNTTPTGNILTGEDISLGDDPSIFGGVQQAAKLGGQILPQIGAAVLTRGQSIPTQLGVGATVAGTQGGGAAAKEQGDYVRGLSHGDLSKSNEYQTLLQTHSPKQAKEALALEAEKGAFRFAAPIAGAGGAVIGGLAGKPLQKALGGSVAQRTAITGAVGAIEEGLQETAEGVGQRIGSNLATGLDQDVGEESFANFVLGAAGGAGMGSVGAIANPDVDQAPSNDLNVEPGNQLLKEAQLEVSDLKLTSKGQPFKTQQQAERARNNALKVSNKPYEVVEHNGGFALKPVSDQVSSRTNEFLSRTDNENNQSDISNNAISNNTPQFDTENNNVAGNVSLNTQETPEAIVNQESTVAQTESFAANDNLIYTSKGQPFKNEVVAQTALKNKTIDQKQNLEVAPVEGGYALRPVDTNQSESINDPKVDNQFSNEEFQDIGNTGLDSNINPDLGVKVVNGQTTGSTIEDVTKLIGDNFGHAKKLFNDEKFKVVQSANELPENLAAQYAEGRNPQGLYDIDSDVSYFVADSLNKDNIKGAVLHEAFHRTVATDKWLQAKLPELNKQLDNIYRHAQRGTGNLNKFYNQAVERMPANIPAEQQLEEFAAYAIEQYTNDPKSLPAKVAQWVRDVLANIRRGLLKGGAVPKNITPADLASIARSTMATNGGNIQGNGQRFSYAGQQAKTANLSRLADAENLRKQGVSEEQIRQQTGWFKGLDGKPRFEIDDSKLSVSENQLRTLANPQEAIDVAKVTYKKNDDGTYDISLSPDSPKKTSEFRSFNRITEGMLRSVVSDEAYAKIKNNEGGEAYIGGNLDDALEFSLPFKSDGMNAMPLESLIKHDSLFQAYPELKDISVMSTPHVAGDMTSSRGGALTQDADGNLVIQVGKAQSLAEKKSTLIHEIQHVIQQKEDFARGGSPEKLTDKTVNKKTELINQILEVAADRFESLPDNLKDAARTINRGDDIDGSAYRQITANPEAKVIWADYVNAHKDLREVQSMPEDKVEVSAFEQYESLAGEIEARDTQERLDLTPEQRAETKPYSSQDTSNPIVKFGKAKAESRSDGDSSIEENANSELPPTHSRGEKTRVGADTKQTKIPGNGSNNVRNSMTAEQFGIPFNELNPAEDSASRKLYDTLVFKMQDKFHHLKRVQEEAVKNTRDELAENQDAYLAELRYHGQAGAVIEDFTDEQVDPLLKTINKAKLELEDVDVYLHARHAPEANVQLKRINPTAAELKKQIDDLNAKRESVVTLKKEIRDRLENYKADAQYKKLDEYHRDLVSSIESKMNYQPRENNEALSGMSDEYAKQVIDSFTGKEQKALEDIGTQVDKITKKTRDLLRTSGLETRETIKAWEDTYQHYVPLQREGKGTRLSPKGRGFDTRGKQKRRAGSDRQVVNVLAHVVSQHEHTAIRSEKAKVGSAFLEFAQNHPSDLWEIDKVEYASSFNAEGLVSYRPDPSYQLADNVMIVKVNGKDHRITFDTENIHSQRIVHALKNLGAGQSGALVRTLGKVNRILAAVNTSLNPEFIISNVSRDIQTAAYNLSSTEADGLAAKMLKDVPKAFLGIRSFQKNKDSEWAKHFKEFRKAGAKTGWMDHYSNVEQRELNLQKKLNRMGDGFVPHVKQGLNALGNFIEDENVAIENAVRLSAFVHARKKGISVAKSARLAKELTVNFNRKGDIGEVMNAFYLFYNAGIQGSVRLLEAAHKSAKVRKMMVATVGFAVMLDMMNRAMGGEDDDGEPYYDKIPDWVKDHNLIVMLGEGKHLKIPLPWGYNVLHTLGQVTGEAINKPGFKSSDAAARLASSVVGSFNPVGGEHSLTQMLSPTITDPLVQWNANEDYAGRPLRPEGNSFDTEKPSSQQYFNSVREPSKWMADKLNKWTGGDKVRPGAIDISPELFDLVYDNVTGGLGRFFGDLVTTPIKAFEGEKVEAHTIPLLRKVYSEPRQSGIKSRYYEYKDNIRKTELQWKLYASDPVKREEIRKQYGDEVRLIKTAANIKKEITKLNKSKRLIELHHKNTNAKKVKLKRIDDAILKYMSNFNSLYFHRVIKKEQKAKK